jgi:hypothetical protein
MGSSVVGILKSREIITVQGHLKLFTKIGQPYGSDS